MPGYVFDTNTIISALLFEHSKPGQAFFAALRTSQVLVSLALLDEVQRVLRRPKFDRYVLPEERAQFLVRLTHEATLVDITVLLQVCRDPDDDKVLELAVSGSATCIISGDKDLRELHPFQGIPLLSPDEFLASGPE